MQVQPLNLWSLWVPFTLLGLILLMAVYLVRTSTR